MPDLSDPRPDAAVRALQALLAERDRLRSERTVLRAALNWLASEAESANPSQRTQYAIDNARAALDA